MIERRKIAEDRARKNHIGTGTPERALKRAQLALSPFDVAPRRSRLFGEIGKTRQRGAGYGVYQMPARRRCFSSCWEVHFHDRKKSLLSVHSSVRSSLSARGNRVEEVIAVPPEPREE